MIGCVFLHLFYSKLVVISCLGQYRSSEKSSVVVLTHFQRGNCQMVCHLSQVSASKETLKRKTRKSLYSFLEESLSKIQSFKGALLFFPGCTRTYQPFCSPHHLGRMIQANAHGAQQFIDRAPGTSQREKNGGTTTSWQRFRVLSISGIFVNTLEVQSTKQRIVFGMIHIRRIPDPTKGQKFSRLGLPAKSTSIENPSFKSTKFDDTSNRD